MADDERRDVFTHPGLVRFWTASAVSDFGSYITTIALQVLVVLTLDGSAADVGFLNASRWLPYLLFGLVVGALVDRRRRQPILVASDVGRGILLAGIPMLWLVRLLTLPMLMVMVVFGFLPLLNAQQLSRSCRDSSRHRPCSQPTPASTKARRSHRPLAP